MLNIICAAIGDGEYGKRIVDSLGTAGLGILLTFIVLFVLIGLLMLLRYVFKLITFVEGKIAAKKGTVDDETSAAIIAAISEYRGDSEQEIAIKSITKLN